MEEFVQLIRDLSDGSLTNVSTPVIVAMFLVIALLVIVSIVSAFVSVWLAIKYVRFNRTKNSAGKTGQQIARDILDKNGLERIKVSATGSIMFGNSYSHFFKKVRLRRLIWKKASVTSLAMAAQKSSLAVLDKENEPSMKKRIQLTPVIYFGPIAFVPLVIVGIILDVLIFNTNGIFSLILSALGFVLYIVSFVMSILVLKTEIKAQKRACELLKKDNLATDEEIDMCKKLFRLYNIEYVNNMIIALLELIYRVLQIIASIQNSSSASSRNN